MTTSKATTTTTTIVNTGEVHCLMCGRCVADIDLRTDGKYHVRPRALGTKVSDVIKVVRGRLYCARCGGRGFVEWDLMAQTGGEGLRRAA